MSAVPAKREEQGLDRLLLLLSAIIDEMHVLSCDIVALGEMISDPERKKDDVQTIQSFDLISQRAFSQVRLLAGLERELSGGACDFENLIAQVPFHALRHRLTTAISSDPDTLAESLSGGEANEAQDDMEWF